MNPQLAYSPSAYRQSAVLTASPEQLVVMLYDGARRFLGQADGGDARRRRRDVSREAPPRRGDHLRTCATRSTSTRARSPARLQAIYLFCNRHLNEARVERDPEKIEEVNSLLGELRAAWSTAANA